MEMNIGDMVAAMAARNEAFRGNEQVPEKVETYNKLKEHAAAIGKVLRAPWYADDLELREQNTFVYIDFPLPVNILNDSIRGRIAEMVRLADMVTLAEVRGRLRMTFTVARVWKERISRHMSLTGKNCGILVKKLV